MTNVPDDLSQLFDAQPETLEVYLDIPAPDVRVVGLRGEVNLLTTPDLEQVLDGQLAAAPRVLIIDLAGLEFLGTDGVFALVFAAYQSAMAGTGFCVAGAGRWVANSLNASGLIEMLDVHDTVEDALATYG